MRAFAIAAGLFAVAALANPVDHVKREDDCEEPPPCLTKAQATVVANNFESLIKSYSAADANKYLTVDFEDYSDSVGELINSGCATGPQVLGTPTFNSRAAFEKGQGSQPSIPFAIENLWHTCNTVIIRWVSAQSPQQVTGVIVMETEYTGKAAEPYLIKEVYSEFNSGAWLVNLGLVTPTCPPPPPPT